MKNRSISSTLVDEWCLRTGLSLHDLQMADFAFLVDQFPNGDYQVKFIKCRDRDKVLSWCRQQWDESALSGRWYKIPGQSYNPTILIHNENDVTLFKMVWE